MHLSDKDREYFKAVLKRYEAGQSTPEEIRLVEKYLEILDKTPNPLTGVSVTEKERVKQEIQAQLLFSIQEQPDAVPVIPLSRRYSPTKRWWVAAAVFILLSTGAYFWYSHAVTPEITRVIPPPATIEPLLYTRYLTLPDGSTVIVHAGSELSYPRSFSGNTREVTLKGEAYFDIRHNDHQPFIIHTGSVKTTVLGTAFNIKANDNKITVTVTRGKVKVEDTQKVLAILTPDHELVYDVIKAIPESRNAPAKQSISWARQDMLFDGASFADIAERMGRRYQVSISFANDHIKQCPISATFNGTESLEEVLTVLCTARNASYTMKNGNIVIDGKGCQ
jgi:ferric-dicitrate binding protein FerR (iron transport regulator)